MKEKLKKQFRELSEEELEKVTGGNDPDQVQCYYKTYFNDGVCPPQGTDQGEKCCFEGVPHLIFDN